MDAVINIYENEFTHEMLDKLKSAFTGKKFRIEIEEESVETDFILSKPAFAEELKRRIQSIENREAEFITLNPGELI